VVGVGYFTVASCRRRSSARTSLSLLSRWALSLPGIVDSKHSSNPRMMGSIRVVESVGFHREGLLRRYLDLGTTRDDVFLYSLIPRRDVDGFDPETRNIANLA